MELPCCHGSRHFHILPTQCGVSMLERTTVQTGPLSDRTELGLSNVSTLIPPCNPSTRTSCRLPLHSRSLPALLPRTELYLNVYYFFIISWNVARPHEAQEVKMVSCQVSENPELTDHYSLQVKPLLKKTETWWMSLLFVGLVHQGAMYKKDPVPETHHYLRWLGAAVLFVFTCVVLIRNCFYRCWN